VAQILLYESCEFGEKNNCYSNWDNEFFLRDCFLLAHLVHIPAFRDLCRHTVVIVYYVLTTYKRLDSCLSICVSVWSVHEAESMITPLPSPYLPSQQADRLYVLPHSIPVSDYKLVRPLTGSLSILSYRQNCSVLFFSSQCTLGADTRISTSNPNPKQ